MSDLGWSEYIRREEETNFGICFENALKNGLSIEEAENCDADHPLCSDCPFLKKQET